MRLRRAAVVGREIGRGKIGIWGLAGDRQRWGGEPLEILTIMGSEFGEDGDPGNRRTGEGDGIEVTDREWEGSADSRGGKEIAGTGGWGLMDWRRMLTREWGGEWDRGGDEDGGTAFRRRRRRPEAAAAAARRLHVGNQRSRQGEAAVTAAARVVRRRWRRRRRQLVSLLDLP